MMRSGQILLAAGMLCIVGCAMRGNKELLETELRHQEDQLYAMRSQLDQTESELKVARKEVETLRGQLAERGQPALLPEQLQSLFRVKGIQVNKLLTGGLDRDGLPGDDMLNVVLVPQDEHGEAVKLPGTVELEVIDLAAPKASRQVGVWRFESEEVAKQWQSGLSSGFQFRIPWQGNSSSQDLLLHARFATADGRQFDTSTDIRITPGQTTPAGNIAENPPEVVPLAPEPGNFADQSSGGIEGSHPTQVLRVSGDAGLNGKPQIRQLSASPGLTEDDFFPAEEPSAPAESHVQSADLNEFFPMEAPVPVESGEIEVRESEAMESPGTATVEPVNPPVTAAAPDELEPLPAPKIDNPPTESSSATALEAHIPMRYQRAARAPAWEPPPSEKTTAP